MWMKILQWALLVAVVIQIVPYGHTHTNPAGDERAGVEFAADRRVDPPGLLRLS